jgi:hypothetical protein
LTGACKVTSEDLGIVPSNGVERNALEDACAFLLDFLTTGEKAQKECIRLGAELGHSNVTLRRAKVKLAIESAQVSNTSDPHWVWRLPERIPTSE